MPTRVSNKQARKPSDARAMVAALSAKYGRSHLDGDPVRYVHAFERTDDREIVAFLSALLAFGNVKSIHASIARILDVMHPSPAAFVRSFDERAAAPAFAKLGHRWVRGADLVLLFSVLKKLTARHGSLKAAFLAGYDPSDAHVGPMLEKFSAMVFSELPKKGLSRGFRYFFPSPADGSPCKRLNMFLRWVVRPADGIDLGLWPEIPASKLIVPLDTHLYRFAQRFRLSPYKTARWEVAVHVTEFLKEIDPSDPVRFDFPICHYGMEVGW